MKFYLLSFRRYNQGTIDMLRQLGLESYIGMFGTRLCATVQEKDKEKIEEFFPTWSEIFENQPE